MPDVQEVFRMATQKVHPEPGFADRQQDHQRRRRRNQKIGAFAVTALILAVVVAVFFEARGGPTPTPADQPSSTAPDVSSVATGGQSATLSPDGTTIAFWRDPCQPNIDCSRPRTWNGNPYVLQVWLIDADGSGLRKVWQLPGCCITISPDLRWSKDGSSIVVMIGDHKHRIDVATGGSLSKPSSTG
jgi:hypothetical protein